MLDICQLTKQYPNGLLANDALNLAASPGERVGILGPNGSGKTTMIRQVLQLLRPTSGTVTVDGESRYMDKISYAPQNAAVYPALTVGETLLYTLCALPAMVLMAVLLEIGGFAIAYGALLVWFLTAAVFLSVLSIALGTVIRNPNFGVALLSMIYMILNMVTPLYNDLSQASALLRTFYSCNPLSYLVFSLQQGVGTAAPFSFGASIGILWLLSCGLAVYVYRAWRFSYIVEKQTVL